MKQRQSWYSSRLEREVTVVRWGTFGTPFLYFPTAGGDAEEIERFHIISTLAPHLEAGRIKIYSCDSVAGQVLLSHEGSPQHRMWVMNQFQDFVGHEVVPAIRTDCQSADIEVVTGGSSIGAFHALAVLCRFPHLFSRALCMSGTYDLARFLTGDLTEDFRAASPLHWLPGAHEGPDLEAMRRRFVLFASGEGNAENIGESWRAAGVLGSRGVPNRVDSWGPDWIHDWPTWRHMVLAYMDELFPQD